MFFVDEDAGDAVHVDGGGVGVYIRRHVEADGGLEALVAEAEGVALVQAEAEAVVGVHLQQAVLSVEADDGLVVDDEVDLLELWRQHLLAVPAEAEGSADVVLRRAGHVVGVVVDDVGG